MENIVLEIQYLPPIQYISKFMGEQQVWIERHEHYLKGSYRNRCYIAATNGPMRLSIPLRKGKNEQQNIQEVEISYEENWQALHWQSIRSAYGNAPFFEYYSAGLRTFYQQNPMYLFQFNVSLLQWILVQMGLSDDLTFTDAYHHQYPSTYLDFRNGIFPKKHRQKEDLSFEQVPYAQVFMEKNGFLPNLSILDLLFCAGPEAPLILESCNTLSTQ